LRAALRAPEPTAFLVSGAAVAVAALTSPPPTDPGDASLLESFVEVPIAETTAVLHVIAALTTDDLQRARLDRVLAGRRHPVPATVRHLREVRVEDTWFMGDDLGDGDNVIVGLRWPGGEAATAVAYIDHNLGTVVKDAFFVDQPIAEVVERYTELVAEAGCHRGNAPARMAPAEARARIEQALAHTDFALVGDPYGEWPLCAPLLQFVVERMPAGGSGYAERPAFDPVEAAAVTAQFQESVHGRGLDDAAIGAAEELFRWAGSDAGYPLRWTAVTVEMVLVNGPVWDTSVPQEVLDRIPEVLPAVIRFAHEVREVHADDTAEALANAVRWEPEFRRLAQAPSLVQARLLGSLMGDGSDLGPVLRHIDEEAVGGREALAALTDEPLPVEEDLSLDDLDAEVRDIVVAVSAELDRFFTAPTGTVLGAELRTACQRFLVAVAERDPAVLRRRASVAGTAASVVLLVGRANRVLGPRGVPEKDVYGWFGVAHPSSRVESLLKAFNPASIRAIDRQPGSAALLTSATRRGLMERRTG
jgi:hypothetical protein